MSTDGDPNRPGEEAGLPLKEIFWPKQPEGDPGISIDPRKWIARIFDLLTPPDIRRKMRERSGD